MTNELDFSGKQVLVVGGSSGIGNGIAQAFRVRGAQVAVCGTRAHAKEYSAEDGSDLTGLSYAQLDVGNAGAVEAFKPSFDRLDILVLAQGAVLYRRGEFEMAGFRKVVEVNLMSLMACATRFHSMLRDSRGSLIMVSSTAAYHSTMGNPAYNALKDRGCRIDTDARRGLGRRRHPRQRHRAWSGRHQDDEGHDRESQAARRCTFTHSAAAIGHAC